MERPLKAIELPDLSQATDEEIDTFAEQIWEQFTKQEPR